VREDLSGDAFVDRILGPDMLGEPAHHAQATFPLLRRRGLGGPIRCRLPAHMGLRARCGETGIVAQQTFVDLELEAGCPAYLEIVVDGLVQHGEPPSAGHGCATDRSMVTSTLA